MNKPTEYRIRIERRRLFRWFWVCEADDAKAEMGPFWTRWGCMKAVKALPSPQALVLLNGVRPRKETSEIANG